MVTRFATAVAVILIAGLCPSKPVAAGEPAARPNILFCLADDISYPHMGAYGCSWVKTPGFDRVAREGLLFNRAYTPNAKCAPSRACILTGRNSWQLEAAANHICYFPAKFKTYAEALAQQGYHVGYTAKGWAPGDPGKIGDKPRELTGVAYNRRKCQPPTSGIAPNDYAANFSDFLQARPKGQPFCFWYGSLEPHRGYEYASSLRLGGKKPSDVERVPAYWPDSETVRTDMLDYAFEIEHFDRHLVRMLAALDEIGELDNTLVVVTADNGMPFPRCKGQTFEYSNHMPLAVMWKQGIAQPGRTIDALVSFIDLAPTFLEVARVPVDAAGMQPLTGHSLCDLFAGKPATPPVGRDHVLVGKERHDVGRPHDWGYPIRGIVTPTMLYLRNYEPARWPAGNPETGYTNCDASPTKTVCLELRRSGQTDRFWQLAFGLRPEEELYDIATDPECLKNLAQDPAHAAVKQQLAARMTDELQQQGDPRMAGQGHVFDEYPYANPPQRGFYEKFTAGQKIRAGWIDPSDIEPAKTMPPAP